MRLQEALDILVRAMVNEQDGYDFYVAAAGRVSDPKGKKMFMSLANDELGHLHIIKTEYDKVQASGAFVDLEEARRSLPPDPSLQLFPDKRQVKSMLEAATDDEAALRIALDFEQKGYHMYSDAAQRSADRNAQEVFRFLADQEGQHYELIQNTLHFLTDSGVWYFQDSEKPFFEG